MSLWHRATKLYLLYQTVPVGNEENTENFRRNNQYSVRDSKVLRSEQKSESLLLVACPVIAVFCLHKAVRAVDELFVACRPMSAMA